MRCAARSGIAAALILVAQACDDEPTGSSGSIQVAVAPGTISAVQGTATFVTVTLTRGGGFSGVVSLAISDLPAGVSATMNPAQLTGSTVTARIDLTVAATVTPVTSTVTIRASGQGVTEATTTFSLTITATPNYALILLPAALTIVAGTSGNTAINIEGTNFPAGVTLQLVNPPTGITGVFTPSPATATSTLAVAVASTVVPANYPLSIRGTVTGLTDRTVTLSLTVAPAPPAGNNVDYQFCDPLDAPVFFARQDGAGAWQGVAATTAGGITRYAFNLTSGRGGVLMVFRSSFGFLSARRVASARPTTRLRSRLVKPQATTAHRVAAAVDLYETFVLFASTAELAQDGVDACAPTLPGKTIKGIVTDVTPGQYGVVSLGGVTEYFNGAGGTNQVTFEGVQQGLVDFIGSRIVTPGLSPDRVIVIRNLNTPDGGSLPYPIQFSGPAATVPATATATMTGATGDRLEVFIEVLTSTTRQLLWSDLAPSLVSTRPWAGLSAATMVSGDFHNLIVFASLAGSPGDFRVSSRFVGAVSNQTIPFAPVAPAATASQVAAGAYPRFRFTGTLPAEYNKTIGIDVRTGGETSNGFGALATNAYLTAAGNALTYDITMPDVAGMAGFPAASRLTAGTNDVGIDAYGFTGAGSFAARPAVGVEERASVRITKITVP